MPICKKCLKMYSSAEMRETAKTVSIDFHKAGKGYPGLKTHWVCMDKRKCKERQAAEGGRMAVRDHAEALKRLGNA